MRGDVMETKCAIETMLFISIIMIRIFFSYLVELLFIN